MNEKNLRILKLVFWLLLVINILLVVFFVGINLDKRTFLPLVVVLAIASCLLGIALIFLTLKAKLKGKQKIFLILSGASSAGFLISVILHNLLYALGIIFEHIIVLKYLMEILHIAFFFIAIPICPISFLVGAIGSMVLFMRKGGQHSSHS